MSALQNFAFLMNVIALVVVVVTAAPVAFFSKSESRIVAFTGIVMTITGLIMMSQWLKIHAIFANIRNEAYASPDTIEALMKQSGAIWILLGLAVATFGAPVAYAKFEMDKKPSVRAARASLAAR